MTIEIHLRDPIDSDFPIFFEHRRDVGSAKMAAFGTQDSDATALAARWKNTVSADAAIVQKTIVAGDKVVGFVGTFLRDAKLQVTYWIARSHWGRGVATEALSQLLREVSVRPVYASAASDNVGSLRVLQKCGFTVCGSERAFANARGEDVEEVFLKLV